MIFCQKDDNINRIFNIQFKSINLKDDIINYNYNHNFK